jgi:ribonuclease HI
MSDTPDILVFSDGSGYKDGFGGWAALTCTPDRNWKTFRTGAITGITVDRAEMTGMLEGMEMAWEMARSFPHFHPSNPQSVRPKILLHCDRENVVLSIKGVYDRSNCPDLWARFAHYEKVMDIMALHVVRENDFAEFIQCDLHASSGRLVAKDYGNTAKVPANWILTFK